MASNALRRQGEIQRSSFQVLLDEPAGLPVVEVLSRAREILPPTEFEDQEYANQPGVRRYPKKQRFATITSVKAGWLVKDKGVWRLTDEGRAAYHQFPDPEDFENEARRLYQEWAAQQPTGEFDPAEEAEDAEAAKLERSEHQRRA